MPTPRSTPFAKLLLRWFDQHGRKNLPWQHPITPYRVWLSEIMLQQTQVETVIPYFNRFLLAFPTLNDLANAPNDQVLHLWTGLGYYARARNLHLCAQRIVEHHGGELPDNIDELVALPGIGRSTAAAITSIAFEQSTAILDGNVKRVLARYYGIHGWPGVKNVEKELWRKAEANMPAQRCRDYTQAIMDLGATVCKRSSPDCIHCPVKKGCIAQKEDTIHLLPGKKPRKTIPNKQVTMLLIEQKGGGILLEQRPSSGIWGGLWSLPEVAADKQAIIAKAQHFGEIKGIETRANLRHVFSHFTLDITPIHVKLNTNKQRVMEAGHMWYNVHTPQAVGLAAPIKKLLTHLD